ncbi:MAG: response regulator [Negativicutes bacterium]|nr:response regulator [Negativicutes bacterium]
MKEAGERIRVLIVDDSPFSRHLIADFLDPSWFEVVGFADGFRSALDGYRTYLPDVVTLDIEIPEMDGPEIARRIIAEEPDARIVILGSPKSDAVQAAEAKGVVRFLPKPFESLELMIALRSVCEGDVADDVFNNRYPSDFIDSFVSFTKRFAADIAVEPIANGKSLRSSGVSVIVGVTGQFSGKMILDLSSATAKNLATRLLKQEPKDAEQTNVVVAEFAKIVAENAAAKLNKQFRGAFLRVSPPGILTGENFSITSPNMDVNIWAIETPFGKMRCSAGFKREGV